MLCATVRWWLFGICAVNAAGPASATQPKPEGARVRLSVGELFFPKTFIANSSRVHLILHLHGTATSVEENLVKSPGDAVLVTVTLKGLSSVYRDLFANPNTFATILDDTARELERLGVAKPATIRRVTVTSFSAGFGGVREILKSATAYQRIDAIILADSLYSGFQGDPAQRRLDEQLLADFLRYARDAAAGKKVLVLSFCELRPESYASTSETAAYLLRQLGLSMQPIHESWDDEWNCKLRATQSGLSVFGFEGTTGKHHMQHLRHLDRLLLIAKQR